MNNGLIIVLPVLLLGLVTFGTMSGWFSRAYWFVVIFVRAKRDSSGDLTVYVEVRSCKAPIALHWLRQLNRAILNGPEERTWNYLGLEDAIPGCGTRL